MEFLNKYLRNVQTIIILQFNEICHINSIASQKFDEIIKLISKVIAEEILEEICGNMFLMILRKTNKNCHRNSQRNEMLNETESPNRRKKDILLYISKEFLKNV